MSSPVDSANVPQINSENSSLNETLADLQTSKSSNMHTPSRNDAVSPSPSRKVLTEAQKAEKRAERERQRLQKEEDLRKKKEQQENLQRQRQAKREEAERDKEARRLQREEEKKAKEDERLKREEEKRQKEKEREEERLKREEEKKMKEKEKEEEKKKRETERQQKEAERQQKELERQRDEEEKQRKAEKQRALLLGFFKKQDEKPQDTVSQVKMPKWGPFMQVELKKDQRAAPIFRVNEKQRKEKIANLDALLVTWRNQSNSISSTSSSLGLKKFGQPNYLHELKTGQIKPLSCSATWPVEMPDVLCLGEGAQLRELQNSTSFRYNHGDCGNGGTVWTRVRLFQFVENYRPAYYGTWRRRSFTITGRRPLAKDRLQLDYEVDSDDEWEEEEPGESITHSNDDEEEEVGDEDDDEDAKFLVPHGYLSDDEGVDAEDGEKEVEGANEALEMKKLRQRLSLSEYEIAHRRGLQKLKPLLLGPVWTRDPLQGLFPPALEETREVNKEGPEENKENVDSGFPSSSSSMSGREVTSTVLTQGEHDLMRSALNAYRIFLWGSQVPIVPQISIAPTTPTARTPGRQKKDFPDEAVPYLIRLIHLNTLGKLKLQFEFRVFWQYHTTGEMPECIRFYDYKRQGRTDLDKNSDSPAEHNIRRTSHLMGLESLSLTKSQVYAKLGEIAAFSEGHWAVKPEALGKHMDTLLAGLDKSPTTLSVPITDPAFRFPAWVYITDVNNRPIRPQHAEKQVTSTASLEIPMATPSPTAPTLKTTPNTGRKTHKRISLTSVAPDRSSPSQQMLSKTKIDRLDQIRPHANCLLVSDTATSPLRQAKQLNQLWTSPTVTDTPPPKKIRVGAKKRATLETFFSPPSAKRTRSSDTTAANTAVDPSQTAEQKENIIIVSD